MVRARYSDQQGSNRDKKLCNSSSNGTDMNNAEAMEKYIIVRAKSLALNVKYHGIVATEQIIGRRLLNGLPPNYAPEKRHFCVENRFQLR